MSQMKKITLTSGEAFEDELDHNGEMSARYPSLFRGQRRATPCSETSKRNWALETTLERYGRVNYPVKECYRAIRRAAQAVQTVTGRKWDLSANLSKSTSNERLRLRLNDVVPSMLLAFSPIL
jgi:hypothetical protein